MKAQLLLISGLALTLVACENNPSSTTTTTSPSSPTSTESRSSDETAPSTTTTATQRNRDENTMTPSARNENESDKAITQKVRQIIVKERDLSTNAKNIKIITVEGIVTLRGTVNNEKERGIVLNKTRSVTGVNGVNDQLEVGK